NGVVLPSAKIVWDEKDSKWRFGVEDKLQDLTFNNCLYSPDGVTAALSVANKGFIGIGTTTPTAQLDVSGNTNISGKLTVRNDISIEGNAGINGSLTLKTGLEVDRGSNPSAKLLWNEDKDMWQIGVGNSLNDIMSGEHTHDTLCAADGNAVVFVDGSNVGIGISKPSEKLDIAGNIKAANLMVSSNLTAGGNIEIDHGTGEKGQLSWDEANNKWKAGTSSKLLEVSLSDHTHNSLALADGNPAVTVDKSGNVGIGKETPEAKLDVSGDAAISGKITAATALISSDLTVNGNLMVNGDTVTVNTATLDVKDNIIRVNKYKQQDKPLEINGGIEVFRGGKEANAQIIWNEKDDKWQAGIADKMNNICFEEHNHNNLYSTDDQIAMTVDAAGNIGIGTTAPQSKLNVNGDTLITGKITAASAELEGGIKANSLDLSKDLTIGGKITVSGGIDAVKTNSLEVQNNIITINKFTSYDQTLNKSGGIEIVRNETNDYARIMWDEDAKKWKVGTINDLKEIGYSQHSHNSVCSEKSDTPVIIVDPDGYVGIGKAADKNYNVDIKGIVRADNISQASSKSVVENNTDLDSDKALELLNGLNPVSFDYVETGLKKHNIGFMAEDVPDVFTTADRKSVTMMDIVGVLTTVVKKQQDVITDIKGQITTLQSQVAALTK
ncbi:MAG: tail fiber domain-containing protein, partial [Bacillota bacterium]|nr:tail fiber domain-containing protein [Bacillota bacterium]